VYGKGNVGHAVGINVLASYAYITAPVLCAIQSAKNLQQLLF
jgi:hypothetical protein